MTTTTSPPLQRRTGGRWPRRLLQLYAGLALYGLSIALLARAELGLMPWSVLDQGIARTTGISLGASSVVVGVVVLLAWVPLRQRPGLGTVSNVLVIGLALDASLAVLPQVSSWPVRALLVVAGAAPDYKAGVALAREAIVSGGAERALAGFVEETRAEAQGASSRVGV